MSDPYAGLDLTLEQRARIEQIARDLAAACNYDVERAAAVLATAIRDLTAPRTAE